MGFDVDNSDWVLRQVEEKSMEEERRVNAVIVGWSDEGDRYIGVDEERDAQLFYYFIKSERSPDEDPLLVWISGGPGCSVFSAVAYEIGPLHFDVKEYKGELPTLVRHPYSWTKWLDDHPQFFLNPLYIGGDSYSGKVVPIITLEIVKDSVNQTNRQIFRGYVAGNPFSDARFDDNSFVAYSFGMGLISKELYKSYGFSLSYYWANSDTVREALHVQKDTVEEWVRCDFAVPYVKDVPSSIPYHHILTTRGYRALVYNGDHDLSVTHVGTQAWIKSLNFPIVDDWRPWSVDGQVAGYTRSFANNLTFALVKGGGHTSPEDRPKECYNMFERWIAHKPLYSLDARTGTWK
ncbi:Serine carboxypeptidase-like 6 [Acorus gramineus]|uniref:Serine carboxypeptidase-like 6 n=1 Tax=Acorus gramineus TaxID=55184 RepID=A0AAV9BQN5_ACOGR|nr:Serine carboxypeptidase-like 6 [Acorus gramineus]